MAFVSLRKRNELVWYDIDINGDIVLDDVVDGGKDTVSLSFYLNELFTQFDYDKPIPPKTEVRVIIADDKLKANEQNTYYFLVGDSKVKRLRKKVDVEINALYIHTIECKEYSVVLEDTNLPNYTITQPKTEFFDMYTRNRNREYILNYNFQQDGEDKLLPLGTISSDNAINIDNNQILIDYDTLTNRYYVEVRELDENGYTVNLEMLLRKTANTTHGFDIGYLNGTINAYNFLELNNISPTHKIKSTIEYYNSSNIKVNEVIDIKTVSYNGGIVDMANGMITAFPMSYSTSSFDYIIQDNPSYSKARIYFETLEFVNALNGRINTLNGSRNYISTNIAGFENDQLVKGQFFSIALSVRSGQVQEAIVEKKQTLREFVEKALFDYNLNREDKVTLSPESAVLIEVEAKESEWEEYDLRELIERVFKYVNAVYYLTIDNEIRHITQTKQPYLLNLNENQSVDKEQNFSEHIDTIVSRSKNIMSKDDLVVERILIGSVLPEQSQFMEETAGFLTSNNIYFVSNGKLHTPNFSITLDGNIITSNIVGQSYVWDITSRFLEEDIYKALPDVRFDTPRVAGIFPSQRATGVLGQGNTIPYKSGDNIIRNVCHQPPTIPDFNSDTGTITTNISQYSIVEMLVCLAYETLSTPPQDIPDPLIDVDLDGILDWELEITYCPIFDELTTKHISNMSDRIGLNWEKKVNVSERVISYEDSEQVLKREMESQGNVAIEFRDVVNSYEETLPVMSIIDNNYFITNKRMVISPSNKINVEYTLQKNFIMQNQDMGLSVEFERYAVPYEYVKREMLIENHIVVSKVPLPKYTSSQVRNITTFLNDIYVTGGIDGTLYASLTLEYSDDSENLILMRLAKMESKFTMILSGKFSDNYGAGYQRYTGFNNGQSAIFNQPYRYVDYQGKVKNIYLGQVGYSNYAGSNSLRLMSVSTQGVLNPLLYPIAKFPQVQLETERRVNLNVTYFESGLIGMNKDAREGLALNVHNFLETEDETIKFYGFDKITSLMIFNDDVDLTDDLVLEDLLPYSETIFDTTVTTTLVGNYTRLDVGISRLLHTGKNVAFLNKTRNVYTLVGVAKGIDVGIDNKLPIYVYGLRYGRTT